MDRFWSKVDKRGPDDCWNWTAAKIREYGSFTFNGGTQLAHRVSWELAHGKSPGDLCVCHRCDNPSCVNPAHLFLDTQQGNVHDMWDKGRAPNLEGPNHPMNRVTKHMAEEILVRLSYGEMQADLAKEFGLSQTTISNIKVNKHWTTRGMSL